MTATHTPGPWSVYQPEGRDGAYSSRRPEIVSGDTVIAELRWNGATRHQADANAALLAAAPDLLRQRDALLAALQELVTTHDSWQVHISGRMTTAWNEARAAILSCEAPQGAKRGAACKESAP